MDNVYIDRKFKPRLTDIIPIQHRSESYKIIKNLAFPNSGQPAPTFSNRRAAVWLGRVVNRWNESPVIALLDGGNEPTVSNNDGWFVGIVPVIEIQKIQLVHGKSAKFGAYLLDAAQHAAYPATSNLDIDKRVYASHALQLIKNMYDTNQHLNAEYSTFI